MNLAQPVSAGLEELSGSCKRMGSPFFAALLAHAALAYERDEMLRALLDAHAHRSYLGLRLGGAAHFRALRGLAPEIALYYPSTGGDGNAEAAWRAVLADIHAHTGDYDALIAREVQTNEVARAMPVLAAMLTVADRSRLPLRIFEIGSSAGLLLNFDRYFYAGEGWTWGDERSPVHLKNRTLSGWPAHTDAPLTVLERYGCDLHPVDPVRDADTLLGFVWPDQRERFERLRAALAVACEHPAQIAAGEGIQWLRKNAAPKQGAATVALHTITADHMTDGQRALLRAAIGGLAAHARSDAPFAWVRMENLETRVTYWPGEIETLIAKSDGHAQNLRWTGA